MADKEQLNDKEIERRREAALKRMLNTPHKPHADSKVGKGKPQPRTSGKGRARVGKAKS